MSIEIGLTFNRRKFSFLSADSNRYRRSAFDGKISYCVMTYLLCLRVFLCNSHGKKIAVYEIEDVLFIV